MELILYLLFALAGFVFYRLLLSRSDQDEDRLGIKGKFIWIDKGRSTKPFFNTTFQVLGKPDLMYRTGQGVLAVEYKSRKGRIYNSDIAQAKSASLAARGEGYEVSKILIKTERDEQYIDLPKSDRSLFEDIKEYVTLARRAKNGETMPPDPAVKKCISCAYNNSCDFSRG